MSWMIVRGVYSLLTLYMLLVLFRWASPWLQVDLWSPRLRWVRALTDPVLDWVRRTLPPLGPFDFTPIVVVFGAWIIRQVTCNIMAGVLLQI